MDNYIKNIDDSISVVKNIIEINEKNKNSISFQISNIFNKIKEGLNQREIQLNKKIYEHFEEIFNSKINIEELDKLSKKSKISLYKAKYIEDNKSDLELLPICLNLENNIKQNYNIQKIIKEHGKGNYMFKFIPDESRPNELLKEIENFGEIKKVCKFDFKECPSYISPNKKYEIFS